MSTHPVHRPGRSVTPLLCLALAACGGSSDPAPTPTLTDAERSAAAAGTAQSSTNACAAIQPFYWEIGSGTAALAAGSVGGNAYTASTSMNIASASKWLYGAYVAQRRGGALSADDVRYLTFRSGYTSFSICLPGQTVDGCVNFLDNGLYTPADDGRFEYGGGHMQKHASLLGLGALGNAGLAAELQTQLGSDVGMSYSQPQLAGGVVSTAADYARFLRKLLTGSLQLGALLGTQAVCTNPLTCPTANATPVPASESWHYSLGHWVEDDALLGDGAFSSAGAFGFYPWVDAGKSRYGIVAREAAAGSGEASVNCGRLIRKAWFSGVVQ